MTNVTYNESPKRNTGLKIWKTIVLFFVGWLGLKIVATGTQIIRCLTFGATTEEILAFLTAEDSSQVPQIIKVALGTIEAKATINFTVYFIVFAILIAIINVDFKHLFISFKDKWPLPAALIGLAVILTFNRLYSTTINFFYKMTNNENENSLDSIIVVYPFISLVVFGLIGPIVEEITYRVGLFDTIKKGTRSRLIAYIVSMLVFALIHFSFDSIIKYINTGNPKQFINELLNLPLYLSAAFVFTFLYDKGGIAASLYCHIFNNILSIGLTIILSLL